MPAFQDKYLNQHFFEKSQKLSDVVAQEVNYFRGANGKAPMMATLVGDVDDGVSVAIEAERRLYVLEGRDNRAHMTNNEFVQGQITENAEARVAKINCWGIATTEELFFNHDGTPTAVAAAWQEGKPVILEDYNEALNKFGKLVCFAARDFEALELHHISGAKLTLNAREQKPGFRIWTIASGDEKIGIETGYRMHGTNLSGRPFRK